ncbi:hypothetical protein, variant [Sphaeroforma arctica JP610]|nr:hypothetical protein, variant [Sphaeroforma arctica JP610]KNC78836.1 hypothetical protein, variant [Sphaeroforma arctica JP610]|eukprot:XP_014152738.1 hypothetical protein, variant [Sphaeroforma arctica JP610]
MYSSMGAPPKFALRSDPQSPPLKPLGVVDMNIPRALSRKNYNQNQQQLYFTKNNNSQPWPRGTGASHGRIDKKKRSTWGITISSASPKCVDLCGNSHEPYQCPKTKLAKKSSQRVSKASSKPRINLVGLSFLESDNTYSRSMSTDFTVGSLTRTVSEASIFPNAPDVCMPLMFDSGTPRNDLSGTLEFGIFDGLEDSSPSPSSGLGMHDSGSPFLSSMSLFNLSLAEEETTDCFHSEHPTGFTLQDDLHEDIQEDLVHVFVSARSSSGADHDDDYFLSEDFSEDFLS